MGQSSPPHRQEPKRQTAVRKLIVKFINSKFLGWLANLPPMAQLIRATSRRFLPHQLGADVRAPKAEREWGKTTFEQIAVDLVEDLGYIGAMVAIYEQGDALPVRAFYVNLDIDPHQIEAWEKEVSKLIDPRYLADPNLPITISRMDSPNVAQVFMYDEAYAENLSVQAAVQKAVTPSKSLYDLFRPVAPLAAKGIIEGIQEQLGIKEVVAVPFFVGEGEQREMVGNMVAAKTSYLSAEDVDLLKVYAKYASAAIATYHYRLQLDIAQRLVFQLQKNIQDEGEILRQIVQGIVEELQYVGAMVATREQDNSLPIRGFYINPQIASLEQVREWERSVSPFIDPRYLFDPSTPISISDPTSPNIGRVFVEDDVYLSNLSVKAYKKRLPSFGSSLYELFTPIAPLAAKPIIDSIQQKIGIKKVIAVPFFLGDKLIGNLFAASRSRTFRQSELELLKAFGQQAAASLWNARLYRRSEQRRKAGETLARMSFTASTSIHELRNHIGATKMHIQLMTIAQNHPEALSQLSANHPSMVERLNRVSMILNDLHEPWKEMPSVQAHINTALHFALDRVMSKFGLEEPIDLELIELQFVTNPDLPPVMTSPDMLIEAFKALIQNGLEAIAKKMPAPPHRYTERLGTLRIESRAGAKGFIEVLVQDDGVGIASTNLEDVFELGWTTKPDAVGFGLFWMRDYIEGLGGSVRVESKLGEGTKFLVRLPLQGQ